MHAAGIPSAVLAAGAHALLIGVFAAIGAWPLVWFNVGSVAAWIAVGALHHLRMTRAAVAVGWTEVALHGVFATWVLGLAAGFHLAIPIASGLYTTDRRLWKPGPIVALGVWAGCFAVFSNVPPLISISPAAMKAFAFGTALLWFVAVGLLVGAISRDADRAELALAEQREVNERLLKQEIGHQVAERSRALSETLARAEVALPSAQLAPGRQFDTRYLVMRELGKGAMGAVYEVERLTDHQRFALKVVTGNVTGTQAARFAREAEIGARLRHPNLVPIVDVGISPVGTPFLVMELVEGKSLEECRGQFGNEAWAVPILAQIAAGLRALHDAGVVHRDLKPANVLLAGGVARISDFGISSFGALPSDGVDPLGDTANPEAGLRGNSLTKTGMLMGTPLYMAPEAARGGQAVGKPADVFAFGIVAYELLSGRLPFAAPVLLDVIAGRAPSKPAALNGRFSELVLSCLAQSPADRPEIAALQQHLA